MVALEAKPAGKSRVIAAALVMACAAFALAFPILFSNKFVIHVAIIAMVFAIMAVSWDLLFGYAGQLSFGHAGFFGVGAYGSALLTYYFDISPWLGLGLGGLLAALFGAIVGIPSLRLRGVYLALTTLAFSEVMRVIATNWHDVTRGTLGFSSHKPYPGIPHDPFYYYYLILLIAGASIGFMYWLAEHSKTGLIFRAIKSDDKRCQALGIDILRYKMIAFAVSGFFAGVAGAFSAHYLRLIAPADLTPQITILTVAMAVIGGAGTIIGPMLAALVIHGMIEYLKILGAVYSLMAVGILLMVFVMFLPRGIAGVIHDGIEILPKVMDRLRAILFRDGRPPGKS